MVKGSAEELASTDPAGGATFQTETKYLGVPDDYVVMKRGRPPESRGVMGPVAEVDLAVSPLYKAGDEFQMGIGQSPREIQEIQNDLIEAGLIPKGTRFRLGVWDEVTAKAQRRVFEYANQQGIKSSEALDILRTAPQVNDENKVPPLQYELPDPEDIKAVVQKSSRSVLGRQVDPGTIERISNAYQAELMRVQQQNYEQAAIDGAKFYEKPKPETFAMDQVRAQNPGEAQAHDYTAQYGEFLSLIDQSAKDVKRYQ